MLVFGGVSVKKNPKDETEPLEVEFGDWLEDILQFYPYWWWFQRWFILTPIWGRFPF